MLPKKDARQGKTVPLEKATPAAAWSAIAAVEMKRQRVTARKMFGAEGLQIGGKVYATLYKGELVLKMPEAKVGALVRAGSAKPFEPGIGRTMREWVAFGGTTADWPSLVDEARKFVSSLHGK